MLLDFAAFSRFIPPISLGIRFLFVRLRFRYCFFSPLPHDMNLASCFRVRRKLRPLWTFTTDKRHARHTEKRRGMPEACRAVLSSFAMFSQRLSFFAALFALLVCDAAGCLASRLAGGLAFAAAAVLYALCEVTGFEGTDSLHGYRLPFRSFIKLQFQR